MKKNIQLGITVIAGILLGSTVLAQAPGQTRKAAIPRNKAEFMAGKKRFDEQARIAQANREQLKEEQQARAMHEQELAQSRQQPVPANKPKN